jgi:hypothetical protein
MPTNQVEYRSRFEFRRGKAQRNQGLHLIEIKIAISRLYSSQGAADELGR